MLRFHLSVTPTIFDLVTPYLANMPEKGRSLLQTDRLFDLALEDGLSHHRADEAVFKDLKKALDAYVLLSLPETAPSLRRPWPGRGTLSATADALLAKPDPSTRRIQVYETAKINGVTYSVDDFILIDGQIGEREKEEEEGPKPATRPKRGCPAAKKKKPLKGTAAKAPKHAWEFVRDEKEEAAAEEKEEASARAAAKANAHDPWYARLTLRSFLALVNLDAIGLAGLLIFGRTSRDIKARISSTSSLLGTRSHWAPLRTRECCFPPTCARRLTSPPSSKKVRLTSFFFLTELRYLTPPIFSRRRAPRAGTKPSTLHNIFLLLPILRYSNWRVC